MIEAEELVYVCEQYCHKAPCVSFDGSKGVYIAEDSPVDSLGTRRVFLNIDSGELTMALPAESITIMLNNQERKRLHGILKTRAGDINAQAEKDIREILYEAFSRD